MDVLDPLTVESAAVGADAVYYLIHGLGGADFDVDRRSATTLAQAATAARRRADRLPRRARARRP